MSTYINECSKDCDDQPLAFLSLFFFFNDPPTTEIYTLSLHDALPIYGLRGRGDVETNNIGGFGRKVRVVALTPGLARATDRKSTRLNSSHMSNSYAVFCLKKKNHNPTKSLILQHKRADLGHDKSVKLQ